MSRHRARISQRVVTEAAQTLANPRASKIAKSEAGEILRLYQDQKRKR